MVKISFDASKMDDCVTIASTISTMLKQASSAVSSAYNSLDSKVSSEVSNLSGSSDSLDALVTEANKLSRFLTQSSESVRKLENSLSKSIQATGKRKISSEAIKAFNAKKRKDNNNSKNNSSYITPEYAQMMLLSGDASQMAAVSETISKGTNTEWVEKTLFPFLNGVGNAVAEAFKGEMMNDSTDYITPEYAQMMLLSGDASQMEQAARYVDEDTIHRGASGKVMLNAIGESLLKFGENIVDGINGAFANASADQLMTYGALELNDREKALTEVANDIKHDYTKEGFNIGPIQWVGTDNYWNSEEAKKLDSLSYLKHDNAAYQVIQGATTLGGYVALSLNPVGWGVSASAVAGDNYERTLNEGGTLNEAIVAAAPMVLLDVGLNIAGGRAIMQSVGEQLNTIGEKSVAEIIKNSIKSGASAVKSGAKKAASNVGDFFSTSSKVKVVKDGAKKVATFSKDTALAVAGLPSRFKLTPLTSGKDTVLKAYTDGMYHFTSEGAADAIIASKTLKASKNPITSYGTTPKAYLFGGVPDVERMALNLDEIPVTASAVRIKPKAEQLSDFKYRSKYDKAIVHEGDLDLSAYETEKVYFGLTSEDGKLAYKEISEAEFRNYHPNLSAEELKLVDGSLTSKINATIVGNKKAADLALDNIMGTYERITSGISDVASKTKTALGKYSSAIVDQRVYSKAPSLGIFDNLFSKGKKAKKATEKVAKETEEISKLNYTIHDERVFISGQDTMSKDTFDYFKNSLTGEEKLCISQIDSSNLNSIFENGLICNERGANGWGVVSGTPIKTELKRQDVFAKANGQTSYLEILERGNYPISTDGVVAMARDNNIDAHGINRILTDLKKFDDVDLEASMYYGIDEWDELLHRVRGASSGKSEGGKPVDGVIVLKLPSDLKSSYVDINSEVVQMVDGVFSVKPQYIEGFLPVSADGKIGEMIQNPKWYNNNSSVHSSLSLESKISKAKELQSSGNSSQLKQLEKELLDDTGLSEAFRIVDDFGLTGGKKPVEDYSNVIISHYGNKDFDAVKGHIPSKDRTGKTVDINPREIFSKYSADELKELRRLDKARSSSKVKYSSSFSETASLHALPKKEGYTTLTEADFDNFSSELIKKLESDATITVKPTKDIIREDFWQGFSNMAENTYFEARTLNYLDDLVRNENMVVAIHKTGNAPEHAIRNIMDEGLYVNGAGLQGQVVDKFPGITRTATFVSNKKGLAESLQLHYVSPSDFSGKGSRNSIVVAYPKGLSESDVVQCVDGVWSIKPEYIVGYVPASESGGIASVEALIRNPKWYGVKNGEAAQDIFINGKGLIDASKLPLSDLEDHRALQQKWLNGEPVSKLSGRDNAATQLGDYELKSDHAYRATSYDALLDYMEHNAIRYNNGDEVVNWYIGGASSRYGRVIIETPAKASNFTLANHYGGVMSGHPYVRQAFSLNTDPIPFDEVTKIIFMDEKRGNKVLKIVDTRTDDVAKGVKEGDLLFRINKLEYKKGKLGDDFPLADQRELEQLTSELEQLRGLGKSKSLTTEKKEAASLVGWAINDPNLVAPKIVKVEESQTKLHETLLGIKQERNILNTQYFDSRTKLRECIEQLSQRYKDNLPSDVLEAQARRLESNIQTLETQIAQKDKQIQDIERKFNTLEKHKQTLANRDFGVNELLTNLFKSIDVSDESSIAFMRKVESILSDGKHDISLVVSDKGSYFNSEFNYIGIEQKLIDWDSVGALAHEMGHMLHLNVLNNGVPNGFSEIAARARVVASNNGSLIKTSSAFKKNMQQVHSAIDDNFFSSLVQKYEQMGHDTTNANKLAKLELDDISGMEYERLMRNNKEYSTTLSDMIDAVFCGEKKDIYGNDLILSGGHGSGYYSNDLNQFSELIANFTQLKVTNNQHDLQVLKDMFGDEFYGMLENTFNLLVAL